MAFDYPFDAVLGRYVLMFQPDPAAMLRSLAKLIRSGGVVVFHEAACDEARSIPNAPTYDRCGGIITAEMLTSTGIRSGFEQGA